MLKYYNKIKLWGIQPNDSQNDQRSTVLLNEIVMTLIFLQSFIHLEIITSDNHSFTFLLFTAGVQFFTLIPVLLNYFNRPIAAKWYFNVGMPISITIITILYGKGLQAEFAYLVFPITIILFFHKNWQYIIQFAILIIIILIGLVQDMIFVFISKRLFPHKHYKSFFGGLKESRFGVLAALSVLFLAVMINGFFGLDSSIAIIAFMVVGLSAILFTVYGEYLVFKSPHRSWVQFLEIPSTITSLN